MTRIAIASDHAGFKLKQDLVKYLGELGHTVVDLGTNSEDPVDLSPPAIYHLPHTASGGRR